ncbi:MAG: efflux RND transporter periplasmic adaptor subunit [Vicinamibacterales bacterium]
MRRTPFRQMHFVVCLLALLFAAACKPDAPTDRTRVSGHVEATEVRLGPDAGGRILTLAVKEGDRVTVGQLILTLDRRDVELALQRARAEEAQADAQVRLLLAGARPEDIRQAESQVSVARADVEPVKVELQAAEQDLERFETLLKNNSGSQKQRDDALARRDSARDRVASAESRVKAAQDIVTRVKAGARREEIEGARARLAATAAQIAALNKALGDTRLVSPVAGVVTEKLVEVGEVIAPRTPAVVIVDLDHAWADVFVPEPIVPTIKIGQAATLFTDAGGAGLPGTISFISPKAEFTPRNVQTADERSKLVYRIRIAVDNKDGVLKQGMPVEAELK